VVEHFEEGPRRPLAELARVVRPGGTLLLTVPYHNALQRFAVKPPPGGVFYQYLYARDEMQRHLEDASFRVERVAYLGKVTGLTLARRGESSGTPSPQPALPARPRGLLARLRAALKRTFPGVTSSLRDVQLRAVEGILPGPICAHTIAFIARR
jgi:hypothetical protein